MMAMVMMVMMVMNFDIALGAGNSTHDETAQTLTELSRYRDQEEEAVPQVFLPWH